MIRRALNLVQTGSALNDAFSSPSRDHELAAEVHRLSRQTHFLALTTEALLDILQNKLGVTEEEVDEAVKAAAATREKAQREAIARTCPSCGRAVWVEKSSCLYCGTALEHPDPFAEFI